MTNSYERFVQFFKKMDRERLDGLDESYFVGMDQDERQKAFDYLKNAFDKGSDEAVIGLKALCGNECTDIFKEKINILRSSAPLCEQRLSLSLYLWEFTKDIQYQKDMLHFLKSENKSLKQTAIIFLSNTPTTEEIIRNLEIIISDENDSTIWHAAARQLLNRYGIDANNKKTELLYKNNILKFIDSDYTIRQAALKWLRAYGKGRDIRF